MVGAEDATGKAIAVRNDLPQFLKQVFRLRQLEFGRTDRLDPE